MTGGIKITPADAAFSKCVRERAGWKCEFCGTQYQEGDTGLQCSHYFSRGNWAVRLEPINAFAHCFSCHQKLGSNAHDFKGWAEKMLGSKYDVLVELSNDVVRGKQYKQTKGVGEVASHYRREFERMQEFRSRGFTGRIEFSAWV